VPVFPLSMSDFKPGDKEYCVDTVKSLLRVAGDFVCYHQGAELVPGHLC
jgi:hypothetical protein